jgi:anti-sigma factor (TIGR02949 family)
MSEPTETGPASPAPIDCEHAVRRLWDYVDGRLPTMARDEVEAHLETCAACLRRFDFAHTMRDALAASTLVAGTDDDAALRERVRVALTRVPGDGER